MMPRFVWTIIIGLAPPSLFVTAFVVSHLQRQQPTGRTTVTMSAKKAPRRLEENVKGVLYVNDKCINCATCSHFAPELFARNGNYHIVHTQPSLSDSVEIENARAALAACPVAAIRTATTTAQLSANKDGGSHTEKSGKLSPGDKELAKALAINPKFNGLPVPFPRKLTDDVWFLGHHDSASFGATPYLVLGHYKNRNISVMVDSPRFSPSSLRAVRSLAGEEGPSYMMLTHIDDVGDHQKWAEEFPRLKRIFHGGDLGEHNWIGDETLNHVEVLLSSDDSTREEEGWIRGWNLDGERVRISAPPPPDETSPSVVESDEEDTMGDFFIFPTPGHSPGSISMLHRSTLFTGDTYGYSTRDGGKMSGFPRYGNDLLRQADTLSDVLLHKLSSRWDVIAPGHGHARDYTTLETSATDRRKLKEADMEGAVRELVGFFRRPS